MVYSEAGGVAKTTTAVSLAMSWAEQGRQVVLIDLDPRAAATKWVDVESSEPGLHIGAVIGNPDPTGWVQDLAVPSGWHENLRVVPSDRSLSHQESDRADHAHLRLRMALTDLQADLVVIDCPNRQGGPLTQNAFTASDGVIYAARPTSDGCDGVHGARQSVAALDHEPSGGMARVVYVDEAVESPGGHGLTLRARVVHDLKRGSSGVPQRVRPRN